jgi:hypothetical protein
VDRIDVATAWQMLDWLLEDMLSVCESNLQCKLLRCAMEARRAFSGGERRSEDPFEVPAVKRGEGWPLRERMISCNMVYKSR